MQSIFQRLISCSPSHLKIKKEKKAKEAVHLYTQILHSFSATFGACPLSRETYSPTPHSSDRDNPWMSLLVKKKCVRTKEPRCHSMDERINFFPLFREGFLFPFLIIFLNALQVAVLHVDGDAVEFNELWAKAERLSCKINEWQRLVHGGWHLRSFHAYPDADIGWVPRAAQLSSATHGSLIDEVPGFSAIVLFILSVSRWPLGETKPFVLLSPRESRPLPMSAPSHLPWVIN